MDKNLLSVAQIKDFPPQEKRPFKGVFLLRRKTEKTAKTGAPFLALEFGDKTGSFTYNCWDNSALFPFFKEFPAGQALLLEGQTGYYKDAFSPAVNSALPLSQDELNQGGLLGNLVACSPEKLEDLQAELRRAVASIGHEGLRLIAERALAQTQGAFETASAAISMHQAYRHGLLEHSLHVFRVVEALLPLYPEVYAPLARAGALLHDIGKVAEYGTGLAPARTRAGKLQGHVVLGYRMVRRAAMEILHENREQNPPPISADMLERLEHIVLSHQGELEWGAAVLAATPEAVLVALADNLDAKMAMVQEALRNAAKSAKPPEFSDFIAGLKTSLLLTPAEAPAPAPPEG